MESQPESDFFFSNKGGPLDKWLKAQKELIQLEHSEEQKEQLQLVRKAHIQDLRDLGFLKSKLTIKNATTTRAGKLQLTFVHKNYPKLKQAYQGEFPSSFGNWALKRKREFLAGRFHAQRIAPP